MNSEQLDHFEQFVEETFELSAADLKKIRTVDHEGTQGYAGMASDDADTFLSGMLIAWRNAKEDNWKAEGTSEYDRNIHSNPDAAAWAKFFIETFPRCGIDEGTMIGWFANAMMARHDYDQNKQ